MIFSLKWLVDVDMTHKLMIMYTETQKVLPVDVPLEGLIFKKALSTPSPTKNQLFQKKSTQTHAFLINILHQLCMLPNGYHGNIMIRMAYREKGFHNYVVFAVSFGQLIVSLNSYYLLSIISKMIY